MHAATYAHAAHRCGCVLLAPAWGLELARRWAHVLVTAMVMATALVLVLVLVLVLGLALGRVPSLVGHHQGCQQTTHQAPRQRLCTKSTATRT